MTLAKILKRRIVVVVGPGGVGKTSIAAAIALRASENGKKAIVCTIDPAKRLATALGLEGALGSKPQRVDQAGNFYAMMLDLESEWHELITKYAPDERTRNRITNNPLYKTLSQQFVGSHGYMAMERLASLAEDDQWDFIVIDTPPSRSALDFIDAPKRMTDFIGGTLLRWFAKPYAAAGKLGWRAFTLTAGPLLRIADKLLGSKLLEDLSEFVVDFQSMYGSFKKRAVQVLKLMQSDDVSFVVVCTLEDVPRAEGEFFVKKLGEERFTVDNLVANKVIAPEFATSVEGAICSTDPHDVFGALATRDIHALSKLSETADIEVTGVALMDRDISDVESLTHLGTMLFDRSAGA